MGGVDTTEKWINDEKSFSRNYKEGYRVYDSEGIACCQKSNGGGIGSYTGLYKVEETHVGIIDDQGRINKELNIKDHCPTLRAESHGNLPKVIQSCSTRTRSYMNQPEQLEVRKDEVSNSVTTVAKDSMVLESTSEYDKEFAVLHHKRTEYGKSIRKQYEAGEVQESRHNMTELQPREDGLSNTLTTVLKDNLILESSADKQAIDNISDEYEFCRNKCKEYFDKNGYLPEMFNPYNQAEITDVAPTQTTSCNRSCSSATVLVKDVYYRIRKLIPLECFRLMGFTDEDFEKAKWYRK